MRIFDSISDLFTQQSTNSTDTSAPQSSVTDATTASSTSLFDGLFSSLDFSADDTLDSSLPSAQSSLLGAVGTSDSALSQFQNSLLAALKSNFLTSSVSTTDADASAAASTTDTDLSVADTLQSFAFGEDGLNWKDGFDTINLLNHIPVVSDVYQSVTDSHIDAAADLAGSFIFGGPLGLAYSAMNLSVEGVTGNSITDNLWQGISALWADDEVQTTSANLSSGAYQFVQRTVGDK